MKRTTSLSLLLCTCAAFSQIAPAPNLTKYTKPKFTISNRTYQHGPLTINIIQVRNEKPSSDEGYCDAWFEVKRGRTVSRRIAYKNIEPVGGGYGLFVLKPLSEAIFTVAKEGDYDSFTVLTDRAGRTLTVPGWPQLVDSGFAFFEEPISEEGYVSVVDLRRLKLIYSKPADGEIDHWFKSDSSVLFTLLPEDRQKGKKAYAWKKREATFERTARPKVLPKPVEPYPLMQADLSGEQCGSPPTN